MGLVATGKITKRSADTLRPTNKDCYLWDSAIKGFALKVTPRGTKTYLYEYKDNSRKTRRVTIGHHGTITADQARNRAGLLLKWNSVVIQQRNIRVTDLHLMLPP